MAVGGGEFSRRGSRALSEPVAPGDRLLEHVGKDPSPVCNNNAAQPCIYKAL